MSDEQPDPAIYGPGTYGCHEAIHIVSVYHENVDQHICKHPAIQLNPEWRKLAEDVMDAFSALYLTIGREHLAVTPLVSKAGISMKAYRDDIVGMLYTPNEIRRMEGLPTADAASE